MTQGRIRDLIRNKIENGLKITHHYCKQFGFVQNLIANNLIEFVEEDFDLWNYNSLYCLLTNDETHKLHCIQKSCVNNKNKEITRAQFRHYTNDQLKSFVFGSKKVGPRRCKLCQTEIEGNAAPHSRFGKRKAEESP